MDSNAPITVQLSFNEWQFVVAGMQATIAGIIPKIATQVNAGMVEQAQAAPPAAPQPPRPNGADDAEYAT